MKSIALHILIAAVMLGVPAVIYAHGDTAGEVEKGAIVEAGLRDGTKQCSDLKLEDFEALGEFFMDRMMGQGHEAMNEMMEAMMGEAGESEMHVTMGKRLSGCETAPTSGMGGTDEMANMMPMMGMMMGGGGMAGGQDASAMMGSVLGTGGVSLKGIATLSYVNAALLGILLIAFTLKFGRGIFK